MTILRGEPWEASRKPQARGRTDGKQDASPPANPAKRVLPPVLSLPGDQDGSPLKQLELPLPEWDGVIPVPHGVIPF